MEITQENVDKILHDELAPDIYAENDIVPKLEAIAAAKGLEVYMFRDGVLKEYFSNINPDIGIVLMAKNEENARWNLQHLRKCYFVKLEPKNISE